MKRKNDFKVVRFNENEPHKSKEWWIYWLNRYKPTTKENTAMRDFMRDKFERGLVSDANL
jgi:hypothetical protein